MALVPLYIAVESRSYRSRLAEFMSYWPEEVVRAKGLVWLAAEGDVAASLSQAGPSIQFGPAGHWVAALPEADKKRFYVTSRMFWRNGMPNGEIVRRSLS